MFNGKFPLAVMEKIF